MPKHKIPKKRSSSKSDDDLSDIDDENTVIDPKEYKKFLNTLFPSKFLQDQINEEEVSKLKFIGKARKFDFNINECKELLSLYENKDRSSKEVKKITLERLFLDEKLSLFSSDLEKKIKVLSS